MAVWGFTGVNMMLVKHDRRLATMGTQGGLHVKGHILYCSLFCTYLSVYVLPLMVTSLRQDAGEIWSKANLLQSTCVSQIWLIKNCHLIGLIYIHQICSKTVISKLIVGLKTHYVLSSKMDVTLPGPVCWMSLLSRHLSFTSFW